MVTRGGPSGDLQVDFGFGKGGQPEAFPNMVGPPFGGIRLTETDGLRASIETGEMCVRLEGPAAVRANDFIDAVTELKPPILD
jgi:hypothetical protein